MTQAKTPSRGWQGTVLKLLRAEDFVLTVTRTEKVTEHYVRLGFDDDGLLDAVPVHPTMWIRAWFENDGALHQRGYTLVDPDPAAGSFDIEFALHDGPAAHWARTAQVGDTLPATVMGSKFAIPDPPPTGWLIAADPASLPGMNSLLDAVTAADSDAPATIWFEYVHDSDRDLPLRTRPQDTVHWVRRDDEGRALVAAVRDAAYDAIGQFAWAALDATSTRAVAGVFRSDYRLGRSAVKAQAYWRAGKAWG